MAGWDDTPPGKDKDAQASHFAFNQFSAAFATDAPISASKFGKEKQSFDDWSAPPVYALDEHASNKPTLFVGNLSWTITSEALFARLGGIGSVVACEVKRNGKGQSKGFALATFQSEEAAQRAIAEFHGAVLEGRRLVVRPDQSEGDRQRNALALPRPSAVAPSARIFVGNVWFSVSMRAVAAMAFRPTRLRQRPRRRRDVSTHRCHSRRRKRISRAFLKRLVSARGARRSPSTRRASRAATGSCASRTPRPRKRRWPRWRASRSVAGPRGAKLTSGRTTTPRARPPRPRPPRRGSTVVPREAVFKFVML